MREGTVDTKRTASRGTTPLIMDGPVTFTGSDLVPAFCTVLFALVGVGAVLVLKEPRSNR